MKLLRNLVPLTALILVASQGLYARAEGSDVSTLQGLVSMRSNQPNRPIHMPGADLKYVDLKNANLMDANLRGANLTGADLSGADLRNADLRDAILENANMANADLKEARLNQANIGGADLRNASLDRAYVWAIKGLEKAQVGGASFLGTLGLTDSNRLYLSRQGAIQ